MTKAHVKRREPAPVLATAAMVVAAAAIVVVWDPLGSLDLPRWLPFLLGKAKYVVIAVIVVLVAASRRHRS